MTEERRPGRVYPGDPDWPGYPPHLNALARHFRRLDGQVGVTPGHLRRLIRRFGVPRHPDDTR